MKCAYTLFFLLFLCIATNAQVQPFGTVDTADLKLTSCNFEKDANAMVLCDRALVYYKYSTVVMEYHKRIKIFNDKGNDAAKVRIEYYGAHNDETISDLKAQTINLTNNTIEYTPVDKSQIYTQNVDKDTKAIVFTFPNIKPGSIVEFKYKWSTPYAGNFPQWTFQEAIPVRYSELKSEFSRDYTFKFIKRVYQKMAVDTSYFTNGKNINQGKTFIWALNNIHSFKEEPYTGSTNDNTEHLLIQVSFLERTWLNLVKNLLDDIDFGNELDTRILLNKEINIVDKISVLPTQDEKIAYIYNLVKSSMKYNDQTGIYTDNEIKRAWSKKEGNAAEINLIVYHFLKKAGINASLLLVNTRGRIEPYYASTRQLNRVVCYIPADSAKQYYVLDAVSKSAVYNQIPYYLLNSNALMVNPETKASSFITLQNLSPARKVVYVNAEITPDGTMKGATQINCFSYNRTSVAKRYKDDGEKKYIEYLRDDNNNLKISALKVENLDVDSLPLTQNIDFSLELSGSDENYIYFSPNLFTQLNTNPFLSEDRFSDIDFKFLNNFIISGRYKIPAGYKIDALPKMVNILMPDKSISFKRVVAEDDGFVIVHYTISYKKSYYVKEDYPDLKAFYQKLHEMLNEQIVLKKT